MAASVALFRPVVVLDFGRMLFSVLTYFICVPSFGREVATQPISNIEPAYELLEVLSYTNCTIGLHANHRQHKDSAGSVEY